MEPLIIAFFIVFSAPLEFANGDPLPEQLIQGYEVCEAFVSEAESCNLQYVVPKEEFTDVNVPGPGEAQELTNNFPTTINDSNFAIYGTIKYYRLRTVLIDGRKSGWSNEVAKKLDVGSEPKKPIILTLDQI